MLLGLILIFMAFRIGKSVLLNFGDGLEPIFIFIGLVFLLVIGPLLHWYTLSMVRPNYKVSRQSFLELAPFGIFFTASLFVTKEWYENSEWVLIIFSSGLIFIYLHFAFYMILSWRIYRFQRRKHQEVLLTKSQQAVFSWLRLLIGGFVVIWLSYVLNILDEAVPYIIGPILYSIIIYYLSYKAYQLKATDLNGDVFKPSDDHQLFDEVSRLVINEKLYLESDLSLTKLSKMLGKSSQHISSVINQYAQKNFNDYINYQRIQDAKILLLAVENENYTISSIAFDSGFSSLSSFNSAFKKFEGTTPSVYRRTGHNS